MLIFVFFNAKKLSNKFFLIYFKAKNIKYDNAIVTEYILKELDFRLIMFCVVGIIIMCLAKELSKSEIFFYMSGVSLGLVGSILLIYIIIARYIPKVCLIEIYLKKTKLSFINLSFLENNCDYNWSNLNFNLAALHYKMVPRKQQWPKQSMPFILYHIHSLRRTYINDYPLHPWSNHKFQIYYRSWMVSQTFLNSLDYILCFWPPNSCVLFSICCRNCTLKLFGNYGNWDHQIFEYLYESVMANETKASDKGWVSKRS